MSIFKSQAVIIKIRKLDKNFFIYDIFSEQYGLIQCNISRGKKEKTLDIGYLIDCEISVKSGRDIHSIHNVKIISEIQPTSLDFNILYDILNLFLIIKTKLPKGLPHTEVFECLKEIILFQKNYNKSISQEKVLFIRIKIQQLLGEMSFDSDNDIAKKILSFIYKNNPSNVIKLTGVDDNTLGVLKEIAI